MCINDQHMHNHWWLHYNAVQLLRYCATLLGAVATSHSLLFLKLVSCLGAEHDHSLTAYHLRLT